MTKRDLHPDDHERDTPFRAITFLGPVDYSATVYVYTDGDGTLHRYATPYFAEALAHFFPTLDEIIMLVTPTVKRHPNVQVLQQRLGARLSIREIPESHAEQDLWGIFDVLTDAVGTGDRVIFDITSSLRSLPFLTFLAAAYLRTARLIRVEAVLYGAFEARDRESHETPVFNLTPFVSLLDWLTATNEFLYTGDAKYLARLLRDAGRRRHSKAIGVAGKQLDALSLAMMLCRPLEVLDSAGKLQQSLDAAREDLDEYARPFGLLAERIQEQYANRALEKPTADGNVRDSLKQQIALIKWYLDNNQIMQGVTLAREWLITAVGFRLGYGFALTRDVREHARDDTGIQWGLSGLSRLGTRTAGNEVFSRSELNPEGREMSTWPESDHLAELSRLLQNVRNELDHAGMKPQPWKAATLADRAKGEIWPRLEVLAESWDLLP